MKKRILSLFALLLVAVVGAWAQEETLLTTLTFGESPQYGETTSGVVSVTAINVFDESAEDGWIWDGSGSLSVTANEGYTITKCVFRQNEKTPITDTEAPFEIHVNDWGKIDEDQYYDMNGVTSIEVYGYASAPATTYNITLADGTDDAANWTISPNPAEEGAEVTLTYTGTKKVKSVKAVKKEDNPLATPLTIEALTAGTIVIQSPKVGMQYSLNGGTKTAATVADINLAVQAGDKVQLYGNGTGISKYQGTQILGAGTGFTCNVYGNIMSLIDETGFATNKTLASSNVFRQLFYENKALKDASGLLLPAETLSSSCYQQMFHDCTALTAAPDLPAETLGNNCYQQMFQNCSSLTAAPDLPATTLTGNCYRGMFNNCTSLTSAPDLPAQTLVTSCYREMFQSCFKLASVKCLATNPGSNTNNWLKDAGSQVTGDKYVYTVSSANWNVNTDSGIPNGWTRQNIDN